MNINTFFGQYPKLTKVLELNSSTFVSIEALSGGLTNQCYKLMIGNNTYVWRPYSAFNKRLDYDRLEEYRVLRYLESVANESKQALSFTFPRAKLINDEGLLVEWLSGRSFPSDNLIQPLAKCLNAIHQIDASKSNLKHFDYFEKIAIYWQAIEDKSIISGLELLHKKVNELSLLLERADSQRAIIHMDLGRYNLLETELGIGIIDWEYAVLGNPVFDIVLTSLANGVELEKLCACYAELSDGMQSTNDLIEESLLWLPCLKYMAMLWYVLGYEHYADEVYLKEALLIASDLNDFK